MVDGTVDGRPSVHACVCVCVCVCNIGSSKVGSSLLLWRDSASVSVSQAPVKISSRSSTPSPTPLFSAEAVVFKAGGSQSNSDSGADCAVKQSVACTKSNATDVLQSNTLTTNSVEVDASDRATASGSSLSAVAVEKRETASQTCSAAKRQMPDSDDNADDDEIAAPLFVNKKQRIHNADLAKREGKTFYLLNAVVQL